MSTHNRSDRGRHAVVALIIENSKFLVIRRSQFVKAPGLLCFPGGGIEEAEDFETAIKREMIEELSLPIAVLQHVWTSNTRWGTKLEWLVCRRDLNTQPVASPEEVAEVIWMTEQEIRGRNDLLGSIQDFFAAKDSGVFRLSY